MCVAVFYGVVWCFAVYHRVVLHAGVLKCVVLLYVVCCCELPCYVDLRDSVCRCVIVLWYMRLYVLYGSPLGWVVVFVIFMCISI